MNKLCAEVMDQLLARIEAGVNPWQKSWLSGMPYNVTTDRDYRGINVLILWMAALDRKFASNRWASLKQFGAAGLRIRQEELRNSTRILFFKKLPMKDKASGQVITDSKGRPKQYGMLRVGWVFNTDQLENYEPKPIAVLSEDARHQAAQEVIDRLAIQFIDYGGPSYNNTLDCIAMPDKAGFANADSYYSTLLHEVVHWTGHGTRLARPGIMTHSGKGSAEYAQEELVAEIGAAFLTATVGIDTSDQEDNSASYLAHWLAGFKDRRDALYTASRLASEAYSYVLTQPSKEAKEAA